MENQDRESEFPSCFKTDKDTFLFCLRRNPKTFKMAHDEHVNMTCSHKFAIKPDFETGVIKD